LRKAADTIVVGAGVVGLCVANALARKGQIVALIGEHRTGEASRAAAGMLAPSVEQSEGPAHDFAIAARDFYPEFLESLADDIGVRVPLNRLGILQVALSSRGVTGLRKTAAATSSWLERDELMKMEPTLGHALGAVFNPDDGAVDNVVLMDALEALIDDTPIVSRFE
jgi:glycine/D-amino acid oxidase-like deaminating enzyme